MFYISLHTYKIPIKLSPKVTDTPERKLRAFTLKNIFQPNVTRILNKDPPQFIIVTNQHSYLHLLANRRVAKIVPERPSTQSSGVPFMNDFITLIG